MEKMSPIFLDFLVLFRSSDLYTHQNPLLLLFHSAGHTKACIIIETPFATFVPIVPWKRCPQFFWTFLFCFVPVIYTPIRIHCYSCSTVLDIQRPVLSLKLPLLHSFRSFQGKDVPNFFWTFSFCFVPVTYTHIRIHCYSCSIVLDIQRPVLSLKLPLLHSFRSFQGKDVPNFFLDFFVLFRSSDLYTHQNPLLLLFHSAGHTKACIITETPFVSFVPIVPCEKMPQFFFTSMFHYVTLHDTLDYSLFKIWVCKFLSSYPSLRLLLRYGRN